MPYIVLDPAAAAAAPVVTFGIPDDDTKHPNGKSLAAMRTRLRFELGNRSVTDLPDSTVNEWINDSYIDLFSSLQLPEATRSFQIILVPDQPMYLLPANIDTVRDVSATDPTETDTGGGLKKSDIFEYRKRPIQSGDPELWFRDQSILVLWPTPDTADLLTVDCRIKVQKLEADDDYPILEDKWHEALFKGAKYRGWEAIQNDTKALTTMNEMTRLVGRKNDRDAGDKEDAYPSLRPITSHRDLMALRSRQRKFEPGE